MRNVGGWGEVKPWELLLFCFQQTYLGLVTHLRTTLRLDALLHFLNIFYIKHELK